MTGKVKDGPGDLLTIQQAAERLGWSVTNTRRYVSRGELVSIKLGGRTLRIAASDLEAFIASKRRAQGRKKSAS